MKIERILEQEPITWWREFVGSPKKRRATSENLMKLFLPRGLEDRSSFRILDVGGGIGLDCIFYAEQGLQVYCNEVDDTLRAEAVKNIENSYANVTVTTPFDWRSPPEDYNNYFDAVVCSGNSLTYLFNEEDRKKAVESFVKMVKPQGVVLIDHRNYDYLLREKKKILRDPPNNFKYSGKWYYTGTDEVKVYPSIIEEDFVKLEFLHLPSGEIDHLDVFPIKERPLRHMMQDAGLSITAYGDFRKIPYRSPTSTRPYRGKADFIQQVGIKPG